MLIFIIAILAILLFGILYSNLKIRLNFVRYGENDNLIISITGLYGIFKYTKKIPTIDLIKGNKNIPALKINTEIMVSKKDKLVNQDKSIHNMYEIKGIIDKYKDIYIKYEPYIKQIKEKLVFNNISWCTEVGTNDAAETAIIVGTIWAIKASAIVFITKSYNLSNVLINVIPNYNINTFETTIDCIFSIKLGYIINADIKALLAQIKDGVKK